MNFELDPYRTPPAKLTSQPYPEILIESVSIGVDLHEAEIYGWLPLELLMSIGVVSGELRLLFKSASTKDGMSISTDVQSGELRLIMKTYDFPFEGLSIGTSIVSGEIKVILIQYTNWDETKEELSMSLSAVSGSLV